MFKFFFVCTNRVTGSNAYKKIFNPEKRGGQDEYEKRMSSLEIVKRFQETWNIHEAIQTVVGNQNTMANMREHEVMVMPVGEFFMNWMQVIDRMDVDYYQRKEMDKVSKEKQARSKMKRKK